VLWQEEADSREERVEREIDRMASSESVYEICDVNNSDCVERLMYKSRKVKENPKVLEHF